MAAVQHDLQRLETEFSEDLGLRQRDEMQMFMTSLKDVIDSYAVKGHYDLVLPNDMSLFASTSADITEAVKEAFDVKENS